jgi:hypothetical protein
MCYILAMDQFLKMDIFFVVTTVAVVVLGVLLAFVLVKAYRILGHLEHISEQAALESDRLREDIAELRADIRSGEHKIGSMLGFLGKIGKKRS